MAFAHVSVRTSDMDRSIKFYETYFGMKLASRRPIPQNNAEIAFLESEGAGLRLELTWYKSQKKFEQASYEDRVFDHLAFTVPDCEGLVKKMKKEGAAVTDEPFMLGTSTIAFVEDPDGTLIEVIERPKK
jgi:lactoylglutathione lyase